MTPDVIQLFIADASVVANLIVHVHNFTLIILLLFQANKCHQPSNPAKWNLH